MKRKQFSEEQIAFAESGTTIGYNRAWARADSGRPYRAFAVVGSDTFHARPNRQPIGNGCAR
jgi:hypothetical protein